MKKKGFTLIEIIVCVILISMVGVSTILIVNNNEQANDINKKILSAANIFVEVEKDENGNNYLEEIVKGAKGVKIPVSMLIDKGYINKDIEKELYKNTTKKDNESYYIMFLSDGTDYCDKNEITALASWMEEGKTVYLCNSYETTSENNIFTMLDNLKFKVDLSKYAVSEEFYNNSSETNKAYLTKDENNLFSFYEEETLTAYLYYRGAVENNYLKLGNDKDENELYWRILWYNDKKQMKLVLDDEVNLTIKNKSGEDVKINNGTNIQYFYFYSGSYYVINPSIKTTDKFCDDGCCDRYQTITFDSKQLVSSMPDFYGFRTDSNDLYFKLLNNWYETTDLKDSNKYEFITTENNFCINRKYKNESDYYNKWSSDEDTYILSNKFSCTSTNDKLGDQSTLYSNPVGFITYGEALRAGLIGGSVNIKNSGNYLISKNNNYYPLADTKEIESFSKNTNNNEKFAYYYYINNNGIVSGEFWRRVKDSECDYYYWTNALNPEKDNEVINKKIEKTTFHANSVKPAIVIDMNNHKLSGNGTFSEPFVIIDKN